VSTDLNMFMSDIEVCTVDPPGWIATYSCGHSAWWAIEPSSKSVFCSQCLHSYLNAKRREKEEGESNGKG
jgi:hypothetical protein